MRHQSSSRGSRDTQRKRHAVWMYGWTGILLAATWSRCGGAAEPPEPVYFRQRPVFESQATEPVRFTPTEMRWRQSLAFGNSSPCIVADLVIATSYEAEAKRLTTTALQANTGQIVWRKEAPLRDLETFHPTGSPAASSPASDGQRIFVFFGSYGLLCYSLQGDLLWSRPMGPFQDEFGAASSPILADGRLYLVEDHDVDSFLMALDPATGETLWTAERADFTRSYSTPVVWQTDEQTQIVVAGSLSLVAYDGETGERLWWVRGLSRMVDTTPVVDGERLMVATWTPGGDEGERITMDPFDVARQQFDQDSDGWIGETELPEGEIRTRFYRMDTDQDHRLNEGEWNRYAEIFAKAQNVALAVRPGGRGDVTQSHVEWIHRRGLPTVSSPVVYRDVLYMVKDSGILTSLDAKSGRMLKQGRLPGRGNYYASLVAGNGFLYAASEAGVMSVIRAGGADWETVATHDFEERIMATPYFLDGQMIVRTDAAIYSFATPSNTSAQP